MFKGSYTIIWTTEQKRFKPYEGMGGTQRKCMEDLFRQSVQYLIGILKCLQVQ